MSEPGTVSQDDLNQLRKEMEALVESFAEMPPELAAECNAARDQTVKASQDVEAARDALNNARLQETAERLKSQLEEIAATADVAADSMDKKLGLGRLNVERVAEVRAAYNRVHSAEPPRDQGEELTIAGCAEMVHDAYREAARAIQRQQTKLAQMFAPHARQMNLYRQFRQPLAWMLRQPLDQDLSLSERLRLGVHLLTHSQRPEQILEPLRGWLADVDLAYADMCWFIGRVHAGLGRWDAASDHFQEAFARTQTRSEPSLRSLRAFLAIEWAYALWRSEQQRWDSLDRRNGLVQNYKWDYPRQGYPALEPDLIERLKGR